VVDNVSGSKVRVWDSATGELLRLRTFAASEGGQAGWVEWSPDGTRLAVSFEWGQSILDAMTLEQLKWLNHGSCKHPGFIIWSDDSGTMVSSPYGSVYDVASGLLVGILKPISWGFYGWWSPHCLNRHLPDCRMTQLDGMGINCWTPDGRLLTLVGNVPWVEFWEPRASRLQATLALLGDDGLTGLLMTPEGHYRVLGKGPDPVVYVVQTDQGQEVLTPREFRDKYGWNNDPTRARL
jgi:WD40 repeat protein